MILIATFHIQDRWQQAEKKTEVQKKNIGKPTQLKKLRALEREKY